VRAMTKHYRPDPANPPQLIKSDLARLDRMTDEDIDYSDIPELGDEFFAKALLPNKETIKAMKAAARGEVTTAGHSGADLIAALQASPTEGAAEVIDWSKCPDVESVPGRCSGAWVVKDSRVRPEDLIINRAEGEAWLAENHGLPIETVREVLRFYHRHKTDPLH
jgi:uncharacterized protein (DUF433 family)